MPAPAGAVPPAAWLAIGGMLGYLLGSVLGGDVMRALRGGGDLRGSGSGNVGATNALRTRGPAFAAGVLAFDIAKGAVAVLLIPMLLPRAPFVWGPLACAAGVVVGHCFPVYARFRGGKGVATLTGVFAALAIWVLPWMILIFALMVMLTGYVSLATFAGTATVVAWVAMTEPHGLASPLGWFTLAMAVLTVWKHRENIRRLRTHSEYRFERARVLGRWLAG